jgi:hypothetical protein
VDQSFGFEHPDRLSGRLPGYAIVLGQGSDARDRLARFELASDDLLAKPVSDTDVGAWVFHG